MRSPRSHLDRVRRTRPTVCRRRDQHAGREPQRGAGNSCVAAAPLQPPCDRGSPDRCRVSVHCLGATRSGRTTGDHDGCVASSDALPHVASPFSRCDASVSAELHRLVGSHRPGSCGQAHQSDSGVASSPVASWYNRGGLVFPSANRGPPDRSRRLTAAAAAGGAAAGGGQSRTRPGRVRTLLRPPDGRT